MKRFESEVHGTLKKADYFGQCGLYVDNHNHLALVMFKALRQLRF